WLLYAAVACWMHASDERESVERDSFDQSRQEKENKLKELLLSDFASIVKGLPQIITSIYLLPFENNVMNLIWISSFLATVMDFCAFNLVY
ncbi:UNVERIFIED_CONTAM: hypothetical protein Sindi_1746100, partial [Sesamum indicum]